MLQLSKGKYWFLFWIATLFARAPSDFNCLMAIQIYNDVVVALTIIAKRSWLVPFGGFCDQRVLLFDYHQHICWIVLRMCQTQTKDIWLNADIIWIVSLILCRSDLKSQTTNFQKQTKTPSILQNHKITAWML